MAKKQVIEPLELFQVEYQWQSCYAWMTASNAEHLREEMGCWCELIEIEGLPKNLQDALEVRHGG